MIVDTENSMITIADRNFPACILICPPTEDNDFEEWDLALGVPPNDTALIIPSENGVLIQVEQVPEWDNTFKVDLLTRVCRPGYHFNEKCIWLPMSVVLMDNGTLEVEPVGFPHVGTSFWIHAEDWWVVEHIDRISRLPFKEPEGVQSRIVKLNYFKEDQDA